MPLSPATKVVPPLAAVCWVIFLAAAGIVSEQTGFAGGVVQQAGTNINANIIWGQETNQMKAGLYYDGPPGQSVFGPGTSFFPALLWAGTNWTAFWLPPEPERYQVSLRDSLGKLVPKTPKGQALGSPIKENPFLKRRPGDSGMRGMPPRRQPELFQSFKPSDFFVIANPGRYKFEWEMRLLRPLRGHSGMKVETVVLPPVTVDILYGAPTEAKETNPPSNRP